ncbi:MAG TPA: TetR/AcrR family transcriptional regulator [Baekduia sp.]|nr:TetR/AcrR family transcriptional regulator [Baekduia sp.]
MPRPRAQLDQAAIAEAFAPDGLHGVSAAMVARAAGVAKPTLYVHGNSKEAVFLACVEAEVERLLNRLYDAGVRTRDGSPAARAGALATAILDHARAHPAGARLLYVTARHTDSSVAAQVDATLARVPARVAELLRREPDGADGLSESVATALVGAAAALALTPTPHTHSVAARLGETLAETLEPAPVATGDAVTSIGIY